MEDKKLQEEDFHLEKLVDEMKKAVEAGDKEKAEELRKKAYAHDYYLCTNAVMEAVVTGKFNDEGFVDDEILYMYKNHEWTDYGTDKESWPEPYRDFLQIADKNKQKKMKESTDHMQEAFFDFDDTLEDVLTLQLEDMFFDNVEDVKKFIKNDDDLSELVLSSFDGVKLPKEVLRKIKDAVTRKAVVLKANKEGYSIEDVRFETMSVENLLNILKDYRELPVVVASDNMYTFGSLDSDSVYERENACVIRVTRDAYSLEDCNLRFKVEDLIDAIEGYFSPNAPVVFSHDNGYTYGACNESNITIKGYTDTKIKESTEKKSNMKESLEVLKEDELKSFRTIKGLLPKFLGKFLAVYKETYDELYNSGEDEPEEAIEMFDKLLKDHVWNLFIGMCASQRSDYFSSDREAAAFVIAVQKFFGGKALKESSLREGYYDGDAQMDRMHFSKENDPEGISAFLELYDKFKSNIKELEALGKQFSELQSKSDDVYAMSGMLEDFLSMSLQTMNSSKFIYEMDRYMRGDEKFKDFEDSIMEWGDKLPY